MLDSAAQHVERMYRHTLVGMVGVYAQALDGIDPTSMLARRQVMTGLSQLHRDSVAEFKGYLEIVTYQVRDDALDGQGIVLSESDRVDLDTHLEDCVSDLLGDLATYLDRDCRVVLRDHKRVALTVDLLRAGSGMSRSAALIRAKYKTISNLPFVQADRLGRRFDSAIAARTAVRKHLLMSAIDSAVYAVAKSGDDLMAIEGGETFSITGQTPGYRSLDEVAGELHPNSTVKLVRL